MPTTAANLATLQAASTHSGRSPRSLWRDLEEGRLTRYRSMGRTLIDLTELDELLAPRPA